MRSGAVEKQNTADKERRVGRHGLPGTTLSVKLGV